MEEGGLVEEDLEEMKRISPVLLKEIARLRSPWQLLNSFGRTEERPFALLKYSGNLDILVNRIAVWRNCDFLIKTGILKR